MSSRSVIKVGHSLGTLLGTDLLAVHVDKHARRVGETEGIIPNVGIQIQKLRIEHPLFFDVDRVRRHKPTILRRIVPRAEVIQAGFGVAFFAGEFVGITAGGEYRSLAAKRVKVRVVKWRDCSGGVGHDACGAEMIGEIVVHITRGIAPGDTLSVEEYIFVRDVAAGVAFIERVRVHSVPIQLAIGLHYPPSIGVVRVSRPSRATRTTHRAVPIFGVVMKDQGTRIRRICEVSSSVVGVTRHRNLVVPIDV